MIALLISVATAGLIGSIHCVGMCGPFVVLAMTPPGRVHLPQAPTADSATSGGSSISSRVLGYNGGRVLAYAMLGVLAGALGSVVDASGAALGLSGVAAAVAGGGMIVVGAISLLRVAGLRIGPRSQTLAPPRLLQRLVGGAVRQPKRRAVALGALSALMPCGWLWAFVITAAGTGSPLWGAAVMVALWAGSAPALTAFGGGAHAVSRRLTANRPWVAPVIVIAVGVYTLSARLPTAIDYRPAPTVSEDDLDETVQAPVEAPQDAPCH